MDPKIKKILVLLITLSLILMVAGNAWAAPKKGGKLTINIQQVNAWVKNFNPYTQTAIQTTRDFIYEPMVVFNAFKGNEPIYRLATDFKFASDLKYVDFTLRKGVKWSDGEKFTADDVVFSVELLKRNKALDFSALWSIISGVTKINEYKVRYELSQPNSLAAQLIVNSPIVPEHIWKDVKDPVTFTNPTPVGTGPFTEIKIFKAQVYEQWRNPHYWEKGKPYVDCLRVPQFSNNDQILAAAFNSELDWFGAFIPDIENTYVKKAPEHHKYWFPPAGTVAFNVNFVNDDCPYFKNIDFRRAFSMALDRQSFVDIAGFGYPTVNETPSGIGKFFAAWNNNDVDKKYGKYFRYDPAGAKKLLDSIGYIDKNKDGYRDMPDGSPIKFGVIVPNGWSDWVNTVTMAVENLQEIGINAKVETPQANVWTKKLVDRKYEAAINAYFLGATPHRMFETGFHSRHMGDTPNRFAASEHPDSLIDGALDSFEKTVNVNEQKKYINVVQERVAAAVTHIPVFSNPTWYEYNDLRFSGWWNEENPKGRPVIFNEQPIRLLHVLDLHLR